MKKFLIFISILFTTSTYTVIQNMQSSFGITTFNFTIDNVSNGFYRCIPMDDYTFISIKGKSTTRIGIKDRNQYFIKELNNGDNSPRNATRINNNQDSARQEFEQMEALALSQK